jgi:hypothetical protein
MYFGTTTPFVKDVLLVLQVASQPLLYVLNLLDHCRYLYLVYRSNNLSLLLRSVARGGAFEALHYKPEGCGFDSGRTLVLGSTQPLIGMNTRCICWVVKAAGAYG